MSRIRTRIIRDHRELHALAEAWWDLWHRLPTATPFQSPAWLLPWWRAFAPGELMTVAAERRGTLVGLALFYREDGPVGCRLLPLGISLSDYLDVLIDPADLDAVWPALIEAMFETEEWDSWEWEELAPDAVALSLPIGPHGHEHVSVQSSCPVLMLTGASVPECLPARQRSALNLALNRAKRRGPLVIETASDRMITVALDHVIRLHELRWQSRGETGVLSDSRVRRFHREAVYALHEAGLLRLYTLRLGSDVVAGYYGLHHRDRAYFYLGGFDPAYAFESPGVIVIAHAVGQGLQDGAREFHFLRGREAYKYHWGAVDRWNRRRSIHRVPAR